MDIDCTFVIPEPVYDWLITKYPSYQYWRPGVFKPESWLRLRMFECDEKETCAAVEKILVDSRVPFNVYTVLTDPTSLATSIHQEHYLVFYRYVDGERITTRLNDPKAPRIPFSKEDWKQAEVFAFKEMLRP